MSLSTSSNVFTKQLAYARLYNKVGYIPQHDVYPIHADAKEGIILPFQPNITDLHNANVSHSAIVRFPFLVY